MPYLGQDGQVDVTGRATSPGIGKTTTDSLAELRAGGRKVVLVEPTPYKPNFDPLDCLSKAKVMPRVPVHRAAEPTRLEAMYRRLDKQYDDVWSLDLDHTVCPYFPICDPIVNHEVAKLDTTHFTRSFVRTLGPTSTTTSRRTAF